MRDAQSYVTIFDGSDPDGIAWSLGRLFDRVSVEIPNRNPALRCKLRAVHFGEVSLVHGKYASEVSITIPDFNSFAGSSAPLKGSGEHVVRGSDVVVGKGNGVMLSPGKVKLHYGAGFEHVSMIVQPSALTAKLVALLGDLRFGPLQFRPGVDGRNPSAQQLERLLRFVAQEAELPGSLPDLVRNELQQTMIASLLFATENNYTLALHGEAPCASPRQVRLVEEYIDQNWSGPIAMEDLSEIAKASIRSVHAAFKANRGYTPMEYVKRVRLGQARERLSRADDRTTVTNVAMECGFGNLGHFARDYAALFGERPSQTLRRNGARAN